MAVTETHAIVGPLTGTGAVGQVFNFDFHAAGADEIEVLLDGAAVDPSGYTVDLNGDDTGTVTATLDGEVYIRSVPSFQQNADWGRYTPYFPDQLVPPLDRLHKIALYLKDEVERTIRIAPGNAGVTVQPTPLSYLYFNALGNLASTTSAIALTAFNAGGDAIDLSVLDKLLQAPLTPEDFGAEGYPTNDHLAFNKLAARMMALGSARIELMPGRRYVVGAQTPGGGGRYLRGENAMTITGCGLVWIKTNGASIELEDGFKFGSFDPITGDSYEPGVLPFSDLDYAASLGALFYLENNDAVIFEGGGSILDLNSTAQEIGGSFGDVDRQLECRAIHAVDNRSTLIEDIWIKNSALDAIEIQNHIANEDDPDMPVTFRRVRINDIARNCYSINGGKNFRWEQCWTDHGGGAPNTGVGKFTSDPSSACNVENHGGSLIRDLTTVSSMFKAGAGSDTCWAWGGGDSRKARHYGSAFDGLMFCGILDEEFNSCEIHGAFASILGGRAVPRDNTRIFNCNMSDVATDQDTTAYPLFFSSAGSGPGVTVDRGKLILTTKKLTIGGYKFTNLDVPVRYDDGAANVPPAGTNIVACDSDTDLTGTTFYDEHVGAAPATAWYVGTGADTIADSLILPTNSVSLFWRAATGGGGGGPGRFVSGDMRVSRLLLHYRTDSGPFSDASGDPNIMEARSAAPLSGTWSKGDVVWNNGDTPANDAVDYWRCTTAGTPGTWTPRP